MTDIKLPPLAKIFDLILSKPAKGPIFSLAISVLGENYDNLSEEEVTEHIEYNAKDLDECFLNSNLVDKEFKILNETPLIIEVLANEKYKLVKKLEKLDGRKFEDLILILMDKLGLKESTNSFKCNNKRDDSLCLDLEAKYISNSIVSGHVFVQAKWKNDCNKQVNLNELKSFAGGILACIHNKSKTLGRFYPAALIYITSVTYSKEAKEYAKNMGITCIDGTKFIELLLENALTKFLQ